MLILSVPDFVGQLCFRTEYIDRYQLGGFASGYISAAPNGEE